jgi:signal transduction histidine kinase
MTPRLSARQPSGARPATTEERLSFLAEVGERLAASLNHDATVAAIGAAASELADVVFLDLAEPGGRPHRAWEGSRDPALRELVDDLRRDGHIAERIRRAFESRHAVPFSDGARRETAGVIVPLVAQGRAVGVLALVSVGSDEPYEADLELAAAFARRAALAVDAARAFREAQAARARAEAAARWSDYLSEISAILADTTDYEVTLDRVTDLVVPTLGDLCQIYVVEGEASVADGADGDAPPPALRRVASACIDAERGALIHELEQRRPLSLDGAQPQGRVMRTGEPILVRRIEDDDYRRIAEDETHFDLLRRIDARSLLFVPLAAAGRRIGVLVAGRFAGQQPFGPDDMAFAEELARRAALAVENARLYEGLRRERERAEEANRAKSDFLATMSHELRTPLSAIIGYGELLADGITGPVNQPQVQQLQRIAASARHLLTLIEDILTYARLDAGRETPTVELVDVAALVRDVASLVEPIVLTHGLRLVTTIPPMLPAMQSDARRIRQILLNLLGNAVRYTERGEIRLEVHVEPAALRFVVADTGIGIAPDHVEQIFEPFWQVQQSLTRRVGGTGLGLSVTRRLARLLGGDVSVTSEPGVGSTFVVDLPLAFPAPAAGAAP